MLELENIKGEYPVFQYNSFIPSEQNPFPNNRILDFLSIGPFVLKTDGSFESEHMYERDKLLLEDYMLSDGGEAAQIPVLGGKVRNKYYGDEYLYWKKGFIKWNCLRFDNDEDAVDPALYATEQRNAVYYAAFYVNCEKDEDAIICYENSGSSLYVNGNQVDFRPFGRVKGLWGFGFQCLVHFNKGLNLIMFKMRPGYIADSMDIAMSNCSVFPIIAQDDSIAVTSPSVTFAYSGEKGEEKQLFPTFFIAKKDISDYEIDYGFGVLKTPEMKAGQILPLRFEIPAPEKKIQTVTVKLGGGAKYFFPVTPYDGYDGKEFVPSDFHFDTTYHQEQRTYALGAFHITKTIVERLKSNSDFKATLSEIDYLHPFYSLYPQYRETLKETFSSGRAESDCFYNQPNDLTSSGEAFVRNLCYGQLYHRDVLGRISTAYVPGDVFGHFSQLSQVCKKGGCNYIKWGKMMMGVDQLFRHVSPDGTYLLHDKGMFRTTAARFGVSGCDASSGALSYIDAYPREGDTSWMKNTRSNIRFSVFSDLGNEVNKSVAKLQKEGKDGEIDYCSRDITQHHSGVILTRTDFKQANRLCENLLVTAEKFASVAFMYGAKYPDKALDKATRQLLCAQHHDSITGTNNEISFIDLMIEYRECATLLTDIIEKACRFIAGGVKLSDRENCIFVFNPLCFPRSGKVYFNLPKNFDCSKGAVLVDIKGKEYPVVIQNGMGLFIASSLPAMGYSVFRIKSVPEKSQITQNSDTVIENMKFRIEVSPEKGGTIVSLYDKKEKRELIDKTAPAPGNTVYVLKEIHDRMETQHELYTTGHKMLSSDYEAKVKCEKTELYQKLKIKVKLDVVGVLLQEIILYKNADTVEFKTVIEDYQGEDDLFTVTFPIDIKGSSVIFDDRFAPHVSTRSKKYMSFQTHQYASFSGCRVLPSCTFFGVGPTVTAYMGNLGSFNFGMTALIREKNNKTLKDVADRVLFSLSKKAVPVTLYPDTEQHGGLKIIHFNEDIYSTDTRVVLHLNGGKNEYANRLLSELKAKQFEKLQKLLDSNGFAVLYFKDFDNEYKKGVDVLLVVAKDELSLEKFAISFENTLNGGAKLDFPNAIVVSKIEKADEFGCVLINNGTPASSVEGKATLNMMLFHTAAFYGNMGKVTGGKELVPEQKSHVFTYSLYPHKDSYREAGVYKKAYEFNDRPLAFCDTYECENTVFPEEKAFLKSPDNFTITAFKAGGYPLANLKNASENSFERGFVVRGFENEGISSKVTLKTGFDVFGAQSTNLLEENPAPLKTGINSVTVPVSAHSIETAVIKVPATEKIASSVIGKETECTNKVYIRSFEHDMGSLPMGNLKFAATIERLPRNKGTKDTLFINAVNNSLCEDIKTEITVVCSPEIKVSEENIPVELKKSEFKKIPLDIELENENTLGQIKIYYTVDGITYYDVYEIGYFVPEVALKIKDGKMICNVKNSTKEELEISLFAAVPFEMWGDAVPFDCRFGSIANDSFSFEVPAFGEKQIEIPFEKTEEFNGSFWAAVKMCVNGRIYFAFDKNIGHRHNVWAHEFFNEIEKANGSIKHILKM